MIDDVKNGKILPERTLWKVCNKVKELLIEEPNVLSVNAPITVAGDIHG